MVQKEWSKRKGPRETDQEEQTKRRGDVELLAKLLDVGHLPRGLDGAHEEFGLEEKAPTQARISVLTGLHRKEVSRLLKERGAALPAPEERRNRAASVLGAWLRDPDFQGADGNPRPLPLTGEGSFAELCKRHSGDMKPRSIADELLAAGALEEREGHLRMTSRGYVPGADPVEALRHE